MFEKVKEAIEPMRYEGGSQAALYWFIRIASIAVPVLMAKTSVAKIPSPPSDGAKTDLTERAYPIPKIFLKPSSISSPPDIAFSATIIV